MATAPKVVLSGPSGVRIFGGQIPPGVNALVLNASPSGTVDSASAGSVQNVGTASQNWTLADDLAASFSPASGTTAPGASTAFTVTPSVGGSHRISLTNTSGGIVLGSPDTMVVSGSGSGATTPLPAVAGKYRTNQDWLFADVQRGTELQQVSSYFQTPPKPSVALPSYEYIWGSTLNSRVGPSNNYVDESGQWAWINTNGDWINTAGTPQGTTLPHGTFAANAVTSGSSTYTVDLTAGVSASWTQDRWNAYIVKAVGGARSLASQNHQTLPPPSVAVTYSDGSTGTLACVACVALTGATAYIQMGNFDAPLTYSVALEFERPLKAVTLATMSITVSVHSATASTINLYLANPTTTTQTVVHGVADGVVFDENLLTAPGVFLAQRYQDGSVLSDWLVPGNVNTTTIGNWTPDLWGAGAADDTKLPTANAGNSTVNKFIQRSTGDVTLVSSSYVGDGFVPLAPGIGALRINTHKSTVPEGEIAYYNGVPPAGLGADLWMLFPKGRIGLETETYTRWYYRYNTKAKKIADTTMFRKSGANNSGRAEYATMGGKWGLGVHHWTSTGGNNGIGGGPLGWTNRMGYHTVPADVPLAGKVAYVHAYDMGLPNMVFGNLGGMGSALYPDYWYCIEVRCRLNTWNAAGGSPQDGVMDVYLDGVKVASHTGWSYRDGPLAHIYGTLPGALVPFREMGPIGILLNCYNGGVLPSDIDHIEFYGPMAVGTQYIGPMNMTPPMVSVNPGGVASLSLNTRDSIDPENDPQQNPNYGGANAMPPAVAGRAPWILSLNLLGWDHMTDYCGSVWCPSYGSMGSLMMYGDAGHSAGGPSIWVRYDVERRVWSLVGKALPTDSLQNFAAGTNPPATRFDHTWGDWIGGSTDWPADWRQPGFNPPAGSHTRASMCYRPPSAAGNTSGQIITGWQPTGCQPGTGLRGAFVFDLDTGLWARTANLRPTSSSNELVYDPVTDCCFSVVQEGSHYFDYVDMLTCSTMTWSRVSFFTSGRPNVMYDSTQFIAGGLLVVAVTSHTSLAAEPIEFWAVSIAAVVAGTGVVCQKLTVTASSYPVASLTDWVPARTTAQKVSWSKHADGTFWATNRGTAPHTMWKLTPPSGNDAALLAGTWTITEVTMTGESIGSGTSDYSRLHYANSLGSFIWTPDSTIGPVQAIKPVASTTVSNNLVALIGDSITDPNFNFGPFLWQNGLSGGKLKLLLNAALSGTKTGYWTTAIDTAHDATYPGLAGLAAANGAAKLGRIICRIGTNDATVGPINGTIQSQYTTLVGKCLSYADELWLMALPPIGGTLSAYNANVPAFNAHLQSIAAADPTRIKFIDDTADLYSGAAANNALMDATGTHPLAAGTVLMGIAGATAFASLLAPYGYPSPLSTDAADIYPAQPQWWKNPTNSGTGGSASAGFTGTVANYMTVTGPGGGFAGTCSVVAADVGDPNTVPWQRIAITQTTSGQTAQVVSTAAGRAITSVDPGVMDHILELRINAVDLSKFSRLRTWMQDGGLFRVVRDMDLRLGGATQTRTLTLRQARSRPTSNSSATATFYLQIEAAATASGLTGSFDFRCYTLRG